MLLETADSHAPANLHSVLVAILFRDVPLDAERKVIEFRIITTSVLDRHAPVQPDLVLRVGDLLDVVQKKLSCGGKVFALLKTNAHAFTKLLDPSPASLR